ncbi:Ltp family lipoprotein [Agromyces sp. NPDC058136]|uniref:Ltp family lipoprotein n=1 Tax=Agromyces sp. NPDC058136 TaxID=3346354 RepID=UPI0036DDE98C
MSNTPEYRVGDVVNGHRLTETPEGLQWVPLTEQPASTVPQTEQPKSSAGLPWYKRKAIIIPAVVVAGCIVIAAIGSANSRGDKADTTATSQSPKTEAKPEEPAEPEEPEKVVVPDVAGLTVADATTLLEGSGLTVKPGLDATWIVSVSAPSVGGIADPGAEVTLTAAAPLTLAQQNAVEQAQSYVDTMPFSRAGLIEQMTSEYGSGYEQADAEFAVDHITVDWNVEAAEAAQSYLDVMAMSRDGLYDQLTSEFGSQFTPEQADFGLKAVGY